MEAGLLSVFELTRFALLFPVAIENRPEILIHEVVVPPEGLFQRAFSLRPQLPERGVPFLVVDRRTRLDAMDLHGVKREVEQQARGFDEQSFSPELRCDHEPELTSEESRLELPQLERTGGVLFAVRHHA